MKATSDFNEADMLAGSSSMTREISISGVTSQSYMAFWTADSIRIIVKGISGGTNLRGQFTESRLVVNRVNGYLYTPTFQFTARGINGTWVVDE